MVKRLLAAAVFVSCVSPTGLAHPQVREAGPTIEDLAALVELGARRGGLSLSPDGAYLATFERRVNLDANDYDYALILVPTAGGAARVIANAGRFIPQAADGRRSGGDFDREPAWSPDSAWVAFVAERDGRAEIWRAHVNGERAERVAALDGDAKDIFWLADGRLLVDLGAARARVTADAERALRSGHRLDERLSPVYSLWPMPREERRSVLIETNGAVAPIDAGARRALLDEVERRKPRIAAQPGAPDVYEPPRQIEITDENGRMLACRDPRCDGDVRNPMLLATGEVAFLRLEGFARADTALYVWTPRTGAVRSLRSSEEMLACVAGARIYCLREAAREPRSLVAIDPATGAVTALYDPNPQWAHFRDVRIERLDFTDARGLQSFAHLVYPAGYRPGRLYPLVIVQYRSRGFLRAGTGGEFPIFPMAARGYFVLSVERPEDHARGRELSYAALQREQELSGEENRMKLDAIDAFIAEAERRHLIDSGRIAITGLSDASETLYLALLRRSFAAASAASPPTDRSAWWLQSQAFRARLAATLGAEPPWDSGDEWRRWWEANSIAEHADEIATPLLFNLSHAEALGALPLYVRLRERNVPAEIFLYPDAYHLKWRPLQVLASQERTIAWFEFWLRGVETADPDDPERIERWRALRAASAPARAP